MMDISDLELWIRRDPARRGLLSHPELSGSLCTGHLEGAARSLAVDDCCIGIVTGFFVPDATPPAAETDGPLGALLLADCLRAAGASMILITDEPCAAMLTAALLAAGMTQTPLLVCPVDRQQSSAWREGFWSTAPGSQVTHLISVERVGRSRLAQHEAAIRAADQDYGDGFRGRYFNMRGTSIDEWTADLDQLFAEPTGRTSSTGDAGRVITIGIGDGGNEIGMGRLSPSDLATLRSLDVALPLICDVSTDWNIVAGTSDWGAFALATATLLLNNQLDHLKSWNMARMESILAQLVERGPAVDGCTRRAQATVDGLPLATYLQPWMSIRRACGWQD